MVGARRLVLLFAAMVTAMLFASGVLLMLTNDARAEATFIVNSAGDGSDLNLADSSCDANSIRGKQCTLRAAIQEANRHPGANNISFGIAGEGVKTIRLTGELPMLTDETGPTTIDGYTQPGSSPNTDPLVSNAKIMVQIKGGGYDQFDALSIRSPGNVVRGLAFYKLRGAIKLEGANAHHNSITGNFLGTDAAGLYYAPSRVPYFASGVKLRDAASQNVIGGTSAADRNVLSGNATHGVGLYDAGTDYNVIVGNLVGLTPSGEGRLANKAHGVDINNGASYNVVGGTLQGERNVISGNDNEGVEISHGRDTYGFPTANRVIGNFIGTDVSGRQAPFFARNQGNGVFLEDGVRDNVVGNNVIGNNNIAGIKISLLTQGSRVYSNRIGIALGGAAIPNRAAGVQIWKGAQGSRIGPENVIANNPVGVEISRSDTTSNTITRNSIHSNTGLGIDIEPNTVLNENDPGDSDTGANQQQNFPVIASALTSADKTMITGSLESTPSETFVLQFFSNPPGTNEGQKFVGAMRVTTDASGNVSFTKRVLKVGVGRTITATATDALGNTSEFSAPKTVAVQ